MKSVLMIPSHVSDYLCVEISKSLTIFEEQHDQECGKSLISGVNITNYYSITYLSCYSCKKMYLLKVFKRLK